MAFNSNTTGKSKHKFSARMVSNKTQATINFVNITDDFSRKIFGVLPHEVTAEQAQSKLPGLLSNDRVSCIITDKTLEIETISVDEF